MLTHSVVGDFTRKVVRGISAPEDDEGGVASDVVTELTIIVTVGGVAVTHNP